MAMLACSKIVASRAHGRGGAAAFSLQACDRRCVNLYRGLVDHPDGLVAQLIDPPVSD